MRAPAFHRLGLRLALLALWLLVAGPLLSQSLAVFSPGHGEAHGHAGQAHGSAHGTHPPEHPGHTNRTSHASHAEAGLAPLTLSAAVEAPWSACDYCTLLLGSPAIETLSLWLGVPPAPAPLAVAERRQGFPTAPAWRGPQPRAPPLTTST